MERGGGAGRAGYGDRIPQPDSPASDKPVGIRDGNGDPRIQGNDRGPARAAGSLLLLSPRSPRSSLSSPGGLGGLLRSLHHPVRRQRGAHGSFPIAPERN